MDDRTLEIVTKGVFPPLPKIMKYAFTLQQKALETHGPYYNNDPATSVSSGPFMLESFDHGFKMVFKANPHYAGYRPPRLARIEGIYLSPATYFIAYLNNEVDTLNFNDLSPADFATIQRDPELQANYLRPGLVGTDYVFFDVHSPPFDDINVRKAFAHAIDREAIVKGVYGEIKATPAHSMLMPGFPAADVQGQLAHYQRFDCGLAKERPSSSRLSQRGRLSAAGDVVAQRKPRHCLSLSSGRRLDLAVFGRLDPSLEQRQQSLYGRPTRATH